MAKILVVEDEIVAAQSVRVFLENSEHVVVSHVESGIEAIRMAAAIVPDLILMDIHLRGEIDGITAAAHIHQQFGMPIIYLTANTEDDILQRAIATDPFGYLIKPFNQVELSTAINIALHRHQLETQLEQTEQWLSTTLHSIGDGTIAIDRQGNITLMNPVAENLTGWQQSEALGLPVTQVLDLIHAETRAAIENPLMRAIQTGETIRLPDACLLRTKDGTERIIGDSTAPIRNSRGEILGGVLVFQDITDRKRAEETLHQREQEFRALVEHSPDLIARFDAELRYLYANPASERLLNRAAPQSIGKTNREVGIPPTVCDRWDFALQQVFVNQLEATLDLEFATPTGSQYYQVRLVPEFDPHGAVKSVLSVARDISDRKQTEETLRQQAQRESELHNQVQRLNTDLENQVLERTASLQRALNFEALLKRITDKVRDSFDEDQILQTAVEELVVGLEIECCNTDAFDLAAGTWTIRHEYTLSLPPSLGQVVPFSTMPDIHGQILAGLCFQFCLTIPNPARPACKPTAILVCPIFDNHNMMGDLWLFKAQENAFDEQEIRLVKQVANQCAIALRQSRLFQSSQAQVNELARLNRLKDDFLSTISHELRTPLSSIKMAIQMLEIVLQPEVNLEPDSSVASRYFQILRHESQREIDLIDDLLNLSRLESGTEPLILSEIAPHLWISHAVEPFLDRVQQQQQQVNCDLPEDLPLLLTDFSYAGRILSELLDNACKYTPAGGTITVAARCTSHALEISVSNTGSEIAPEELPRIFDTFYRIPSSDPWRYSGTGLGLALVKKLAAQLSASIRAESSAECTTFTLIFPLCA